MANRAQSPKPSLVEDYRGATGLQQLVSLLGLCEPYELRPRPVPGLSQAGSASGSLFLFLGILSHGFTVPWSPTGPCRSEVQGWPMAKACHAARGRRGWRALGWWASIVEAWLPKPLTRRQQRQRCSVLPSSSPPPPSPRMVAVTLEYAPC